jgi:DnaJ-class molecular chaperone
MVLCTCARMKKITDYRKLLNVSESASLQDLKAIYRSFMKDWHPDKFNGDEEALKEAELKSKSFIEAYHFLVSIAPETRSQTINEYNETTIKAGITDFEFKSQVLTVSFSDGATYEYFDVPKAIYTKLVNADSPGRFARRHIFTSYIYRSTRKIAVTA